MALLVSSNVLEQGRKYNIFANSVYCTIAEMSDFNAIFFKKSGQFTQCGLLVASCINAKAAQRHFLTTQSLNLRFLPSTKTFVVKSDSSSFLFKKEFSFKLCLFSVEINHLKMVIFYTEKSCFVIFHEKKIVKKHKIKLL